MNKYTYEIRTIFNKDRIELGYFFYNPKLDSMISDKVKVIIDLKEKAIRDSLISLGWTPPSDTYGSE